MASLQPVSAGFIIVPSRERERRYLAWYAGRDESTIPLEGALFELRISEEHRGDVVLLPLRSYEAATRMRKAFEGAARAHERAQKQRSRFSLS
jgi:hypothetical protein